MRVKRCAVQHCSKTSVNSSATFFSFPRSKEIRLKWLKSIEVPRLMTLPATTLKNYAVCGRHFESSNFQTREQLKLNRNAVPTLFMQNISLVQGASLVSTPLSALEDLNRKVEESNSTPVQHHAVDVVTTPKTGVRSFSPLEDSNSSVEVEDNHYIPVQHHAIDLVTTKTVFQNAECASERSLPKMFPVVDSTLGKVHL